jgi:uncharacterized protein YndB with AHSA1/START domain
MFPCERVGVDFIDSAPYRVTTSVDLPVSPEQLFDVLTDVSAWPQWFDVIATATWIDPEPRGVGSTRTISMRRGGVATEEFIVWKPHRHLAFRFNECSDERAGASAEEYRIEATDRGCRLIWTVAQSPVDPPWPARVLARSVMKRKYRASAAELRRYLDRRFGVTI